MEARRTAQLQKKQCYQLLLYSIPRFIFVTKQSNSVLKGNNCVNDDAISFRNQVGLVMEWAPHCRADMGRLQNSFKSNPDIVIFTLGASDRNTLAFLVCHRASDFGKLELVWVLKKAPC